MTCKIKIIFLFLAAALMFCACNKKYVTNQYRQISDETWSYFDTLEYSFDITDTVSTFSVYLNVIHNKDYKYRNLYLFTRLSNPDSTLNCDTLQLLLSTQSGDLLGRGLGTSKEAKFILAKDIRFQHKGKYSLQVIQGMRDECIHGVEKIGFVVSK